MHAFVHSSYVSERVLAQEDVCMFAKWMVLVVPSTRDHFILTPKLNRSTDKQTDHTRQFHLALMMDNVFSYMHAFVHSSYVSERVLSRADVCMFAEWMLFVVSSSPGDFFLYMHAVVHLSYVSEHVLTRADVCMFPELIMFVVPFSPCDSILTQKLNRCTNKQTDHTRQFISCASKCVYVCVFMLNTWCLLFHLALVIDSYACMSSCICHTWARVYLHQRMCVCLLHESFLLFHLTLMRAGALG